MTESVLEASYGMLLDVFVTAVGLSHRFYFL